MNRSGIVLLASILVVLSCVRVTSAQNPVQWGGSTSQAVDRAAEQSLPLLFWVTEGRVNDDNDDLSDAQSECFRDPEVVGIVERCFVPVRVSRNSNVIREAERLGLPTSHGLYCAVLTSDGRLLEQMGPGEVADPVAFASKLTSAYGKFCDDLLEKELRPILADPKAAKSRVRLVVQTIWRLKIQSADKDVIGLLSRTDLTPGEKERLYGVLAGLGTHDCITALLARAEEKAAATALGRAEPHALEWLTPELPTEDGEVTTKQLAVYTAVIRICHQTSAKTMEWWKKATADDRRKEIERVRAKAQAVLEYWQQSQTPSR